MQELRLQGHENLNQPALNLQKAHNANLSHQDRWLKETLDKRKRLGDEMSAKRVEKDRLRTEAMAIERLSNGSGIRGISGLLAAQNKVPRRR